MDVTVGGTESLPALQFAVQQPSVAGQGWNARLDVAGRLL